MNKFSACAALIIFLSFSASCTTKPCGATCEPASEEEDRTVNTEKLIGTPFEGKTTGDDFEPYFFWCGQYRTETIDSFPIEIFTAFFDNVEDQIIEQGVEIANQAVGFDAYEIIDEWLNDVRVIYKVNEIQYGDQPAEENIAGRTLPVWFYFNDNTISEIVSTDWAIELTASGVEKYTIAHEMGHASGLTHCLINYLDNSCDYNGLEENSIMGTDGGSQLTDYNFMMQKQGEIMLNHLGDTGGTLDTGNCGDE